MDILVGDISTIFLPHDVSLIHSTGRHIHASASPDPMDLDSAAGVPGVGTIWALL